MKAVNLIPAEQRRGAGGLAGRSGGVAYLLAGGLAILVVLGVVYALAVHNVAQKRGELASVTAQVNSVQAQTQLLQPYVDFASATSARVGAASSLAKQRFNWPSAMRQLALALPPDVTFTGLSATAGTPGDATSGTPATPSAFNLTGCAATQGEIARVLTSLTQVPGVTDVSLVNTQESARMTKHLTGKAAIRATEAGAGGGQCPYVTFSLGVQYSPGYTVPDRRAPAQSTQTVSAPSGATDLKTAASQQSTGVAP